MTPTANPNAADDYGNYEDGGPMPFEFRKDGDIAEVTAYLTADSPPPAAQVGVLARAGPYRSVSDIAEPPPSFRDKTRRSSLF